MQNIFAEVFFVIFMIYDIIILNHRYIEAKMTDERKEFGKKLIEIRERKGLRQADVAEIIQFE